MPCYDLSDNYQSCMFQAEDIAIETARAKRGQVTDPCGVVAWIGGGEGSSPSPPALVHSTDEERDGPRTNLLCDDRLATDGIGASGRQHPVQDRHADGSLGLLGSEAAGPQTWSDQRLVPTHCCFY
jgi:hypothetical protein